MKRGRGWSEKQATVMKLRRRRLAFESFYRAHPDQGITVDATVDTGMQSYSGRQRHPSVDDMVAAFRAKQGHAA